MVKHKSFLFMLNDMRVGGAEVGLVDVLNELAKENKVDLVLLRKRGSLLERLDPNIRVFSIMRGERSFFYNQYIRFCYFAGGIFARHAYKRTIKDEYDVEVAYLEGYPAVFITNSPNKKSVKITSIRVGLKKHTMKILSFAHGRRLLQRAYEKADAIHCVSERTRQEFNEMFPTCAGKSHTLYTYFDVDSIREKAEGGEPAFDAACVNFLAVGRFAPQKAYDRLIEAFERIHSEYPQTVLHILGNDATEYGANMKALIEQKGLGRSVVIHGVVANPYPYIKHCDVLVSSSLYEGFPRVINEGLALGKLCIGTDVTGTREALQEGKLGLLARDSAQGIYACMKEYMVNPGIAQGYAAVLATFDGNKRHFFDGFAALCERKKRLILFAPKLTIGGMEKALVNLLKDGGLMQKYAVTLFCVYKGNPNQCDRLPENLKLILACRGEWNLWGKLEAGLRLAWYGCFMQRYDAAICYAHHHPVLARLARRASDNHTLFVHSNILRALSLPKAQALVKKLEVSEFQNVICVSEDAKSVVQQLTGRRDIHAINNLIDGDAILDQAAAPVTDYVFGPRPVFVHVSRHDEKPKALFRLFDACKRLNADGFAYDVLLLGDGPDHESYRQAVEKMGLTNIHLLGSKRNPYPYMKAASAMVLCSRYEGYPVVFLEAMVLGVPIITTDVSDARREIEGRYGIVVDNQDDTIYNGMREFLLNGFTLRSKFDYEAFNQQIVQRIHAILE